MTTFKSSLPELNGTVYQTLSNFRQKTATPIYYLRLKCGLLFVHEDADQPHNATHILVGAKVTKGLYPNSVRIQKEGRTLLRFVCKSPAEHSTWMYALAASSKWTLDTHYDRIRTIAVGQSGTVIEVRRKSTQGNYAVKCIPHDRVGLFELPIATTVGHDHVLGALEVLHHTAETYVVFPLMADTLRNVKPLSEEQTKTLARHLLAGVRYLHDRNIVHRDLTSRNVLRKANGDWTIADFGNAHMATEGGEDDQIHSIDGSMLISPYYAAPELSRLAPHDGAVDMWSIGVMIFEALSGRRPFDGSTYEEVETKAMNGEFDMVGDEWDSVSGEAKDFIWSLLEIDPKTRIGVHKALKHSWLEKN